MMDVLRRSWKLLGSLFERAKSAISYIAFAASLATGISLISDRKFAEAVYFYLASLSKQAQTVLDQVGVVAHFWRSSVVQPIYDWWSLHIFTPPISLVEVLTLILFAAGPILRAHFLSKTLKREIGTRLNLLQEMPVKITRISSQKDQLVTARTALLQKEKELEQEKSALQFSLAKAQNTKLTDKALKVAQIVFGAAGVVGGFLQMISGRGGGQTIAQSSMLMHRGAQSFGQGTNNPTDLLASASKIEERLIQNATEKGKIEHAIRDAEKSLVELNAEFERLRSRDGGLLVRLAEYPQKLAEEEIRKHITSKLKLQRLVSRISLGMVVAVCGSYIIDAAVESFRI